MTDPKSTELNIPDYLSGLWADAQIAASKTWLYMSLSPGRVLDLIGRIARLEKFTSPYTCLYCGRPLYKEDDDMITMGGMYEVWYCIEPNGKRRMSCLAPTRAHKPREG